MTYNNDIIINLINAFFIKEQSEHNNKNKNNDNNLNIKGQWGSGKTTYIKKLKEELDKKNYQVKIFNVWEYEISDNIFVSILCDILDFLEYEPKTNWKIKRTLLSIANKIPFFEIIKNILDNSKEKINLFELNNFNDSLLELINECNDLIKNKKNNKYIIIFDELDRCTTPKMIEFLSIIKNILFKLNNCFFIVSCDSDKINKMLIQNELNNNENYTDKIFYNTINIEFLTNFDYSIYNESEIFKNNDKLEKFINDNFNIKKEYTYRQKKKIAQLYFKFNNNLKKYYLDNTKKIFELFILWFFKNREENTNWFKNLNNNEINEIINNFYLNYNSILDKYRKTKYKLYGHNITKEKIKTLLLEENKVLIKVSDKFSFLFNICIPFIKNEKQIKYININFKKTEFHYVSTGETIAGFDFFAPWEINFNEIKKILDQNFIDFIEWINKNIVFDEEILWKIENYGIVDFYNNFKFNL